MKNYEPPDRPLTTLSTRREFLLLIAEGGRDVIRDLFGRCFKPFLRLTHYTPLLLISDGGFTEAELFNLESMKYAEMDIETHRGLLAIGASLQAEGDLRNLVFRYLAICDLHKSLLSWGEHWNLKADWFYEFGHRVLMEYWQKNYKSQSKTQIAGAMPTPSKTILLRPPSNAISPKPSPITVASQRMQLVSAISAIRGKEGEPKEEQSGWKEINCLTGGIVTKELWEFWRVANASQFDTLRHLVSWQTVAEEFVREAEIRMTAPEEEWSNKFTKRWLPFIGATGKDEYISPELRPIQAPKPSDYFPPIASWEPGRNHVVTWEIYEREVKRKIRVDLDSSLAKYVSEKIRKKWEDRIFKDCKRELERYWREYCEHLKDQKWEEVIEKKDLRRHCKWFLLHVVSGWTQGEIIQHKEGKGQKTNISQRINEIAAMLGMSPLKRGTKGKLKFTWED